MPHRPIDAIFAKTHPYDALPEEARVALAKEAQTRSFSNGAAIYAIGAQVAALEDNA